MCENIDTLNLACPQDHSDAENPDVVRQQQPALSRRERQIMDVVYRLGRAAATNIHAALPDPPTYTAVRGLLRILVEKGHLRHHQEGRRYVYLPSTSRPEAGASSITHVVRTFFAGSPSDAMAALLGAQKDRISDDELTRLAALVAEARRNKRAQA